MWLGQTIITLTNEEAKTTPESDCMRSVYRLSWTFFFLTCCKNCDSKIEQHIILKFLVIEETTALSVEQFLAEKCIVSSLFTWPSTMRLYSFAKNKKVCTQGNLLWVWSRSGDKNNGASEANNALLWLAEDQNAAVCSRRRGTELNCRLSSLKIN